MNSWINRSTTKLLGSSALAVTLLASGTTQAAGLSQIGIPAAVKEAVDSLYETTRSNLDQGGISEIRLFALDAGISVSETIASVLRRGLSARLEDFCWDLNKKFDTKSDDQVNACVVAILRKNSPQRVAKAMGEVREMASGSPRSLAEINKIDEFVANTIPKPEASIYISTQGLNVDDDTALIVDTKNQRLLILEMDFGA